MPVSASELERLEAYQGSMEVPADFDAFWAERMAEADAVALDYEVLPAGIGAPGTCDCYDLWFFGMGGARLYARYLRPATDAAVPLVLRFHGYPGRTRSWLENCSFVGAGFADITMDNPGQGGRSQDVGGFLGPTVAGHLVAGLGGEPKDLYYVRLYQDVRILCRVVAQLPGIDLAHVAVYGDSQGGGVGLATCALNPDLISRAGILYPFLSDFRRVWELGADQIAYEGVNYYSRWFDSTGERAGEWLGKLAYYDTSCMAHLVRCPVLFATGLSDAICPPETQYATYNRLACPKRHVLYPSFGHEEIQDFDDRLVDFFWGGEAL